MSIYIAKTLPELHKKLYMFFYRWYCPPPSTLKTLLKKQRFFWSTSQRTRRQEILMTPFFFCIAVLISNIRNRNYPLVALCVHTSPLSHKQKIRLRNASKYIFTPSVFSAFSSFPWPVGGASGSGDHGGVRKVFRQDLNW